MAEKPEVVVEIQDEGPCKKRMTAQVPADSITEEINANYKQLVDTVQIPGFRKGKVPRSLLERRYAEKIEEEVKEELMFSTFQDEVEKLELRVLGQPEFDNIEFKVGEPLRYDAVFEVHPTFDVPEYQGLSIDARPIVVSDEDLEREIEGLRQQWGSFEDISFGEQKEEDLAVVDATFKDGDDELLTREDVYLKIGNDRVDNIVVEGLGQKLQSASAAETLTFAVEIGDDFPREDLRNRKVDLSLELKSVQRRELPELNDEFAQRSGAESVAALRDNVKQSLTMRRTIQEEHRQEEELVDRLCADLEMELPGSLVERRANEMEIYERIRLMREGKDEEEIKTLLEDGSQRKTDAQKEIAQLFLLDRIAEDEQIFVTEDEVASRLHAIAATQQRDPNEVLEEYRDAGRLEELRNGLMREKVRAFIRQKAEVSTADAPASATTDSTDANEEGNDG